MEEAGAWAKSEYDHAVDVTGKKQDEAAIKAFKFNLAWNMGEVSSTTYTRQLML